MRYLFTLYQFCEYLYYMNDVDLRKDAAKGMGMTGWQSIIKLCRWPHRRSCLVSGCQRLTWLPGLPWRHTLPGLGDFIFNGLNLYRSDLIRWFNSGDYSSVAGWLARQSWTALTPQQQKDRRGNRENIKRWLIMLGSLLGDWLAGCGFPGLAGTADTRSIVSKYDWTADHVLYDSRRLEHGYWTCTRPLLIIYIG